MKKIIFALLAVLIFVTANAQNNITNFYEDDNAIYYWQNVNSVGTELFSIDKKTKKINLVKDIIPGYKGNLFPASVDPIIENGKMYIPVSTSAKNDREYHWGELNLFELNLKDKSLKKIATNFDILTNHLLITPQIIFKRINYAYEISNKDSTKNIKGNIFFDATTFNSKIVYLEKFKKGDTAYGNLIKLNNDGSVFSKTEMSLPWFFYLLDEIKNDPIVIPLNNKTLILSPGIHKDYKGTTPKEKIYAEKGIIQVDDNGAIKRVPFIESYSFLKSLEYAQAIKGSDKYLFGKKRTLEGTEFNELVELPDSLGAPIKMLCNVREGIIAMGVTNSGFYSIREKGDSLLFRYRNFQSPTVDSILVKFKLDVKDKSEIKTLGEEALFALKSGKLASINLRTKVITIYNPNGDDDGDGIANALDNCTDKQRQFNNGCSDTKFTLPPANKEKLWGKNFGTAEFDDLLSLNTYGDSSFYFSTKSKYTDSNVPMLKFNYHEIFGKKIVNEDKLTGVAIEKYYEGSDNENHYMYDNDKEISYQVNAKTLEVEKAKFLTNRLESINIADDLLIKLSNQEYQYIKIYILENKTKFLQKNFNIVAKENYVNNSAKFSKGINKYTYTLKHLPNFYQNYDKLNYGDENTNIIVYFNKDSIIKKLFFNNLELSIKDEEKNFFTTTATNTGFTVFCSTTDNYDDPKIPYQRVVRVMDFDTLGKLINTKILPAFNYAGMAYKDAILTNDGGYMVAAEMMQDSSDYSFKKYDNPQDIILFKYSKDLKLEWHKQLIGNKSDNFSKLVQLKNNNYVLAVQTNSDGGDYGTNKGNFDLWIGIIPDYKVPVAKATKPAIVKTPVVKKPQPTKTKN